MVVFDGWGGGSDGGVWWGGVVGVGGWVPVEAEAVQTLFARLVDRVQPGAWVLLLPAVWSPTQPQLPGEWTSITHNMKCA